MTLLGVPAYAIFEEKEVIILRKLQKRGSRRQFYYQLEEVGIKHCSLIKKLSDEGIKELIRDKKLKQLGI
jgi:hypothetical protein